MKLFESSWPITLCSILLLSVGILVIYSSSKELAIQQGIFALIGLGLYFFISQFDYRSLTNFIKPFYFFSAFLLVVVLFLGVETRGVIRWIPIGPINLQPSEFAKPALILLLAQFWSKRFSSWGNIFKSLLWSLPAILLIFKQPDLGSTITIMAIWGTMVFASGISARKLLTAILLLVLVLPLIWFTLVPYQKQRIVGFLSPESDPLGKGYNLIQSQIAVGSGELMGRGLGRGTQSRLQFLPEFRTDFIFSAISEEMGFVGAILILSIYLTMLVYNMRIAGQAYDRFGFLITCGVSAMILFQVLINVGMNIGLVPITGITLPLISYGGSSSIATLLTLGLVASVAKLRRKL